MKASAETVYPFFFFFHGLHGDDIVKGHVMLRKQEDKKKRVKNENKQT